MNETNETNRNDKTAADLADVAKLNDLRRDVETYGNKHVEAMKTALEAAKAALHDETVQRAKKVADLAIARFGAFKRTLPPVKFCTADGEYFPAYTKDGKENFRVTVTTTIRRTVEVSAADETAAVEAVREMQGDPGFWNGVAPETAIENDCDFD